MAVPLFRARVTVCLVAGLFIVKPALGAAATASTAKLVWSPSRSAGSNIDTPPCLRARHDRDRHPLRVRLQRPGHRRQAGAAGRLSRQGAADRQHRQRVRLHAAVRRARGAATSSIGPRASRCWAFPATSSATRSPGTDAEIGAFCSTNYGVTFPMFAKIEVNGGGAHPLYEWLKRRSARACSAPSASSGTSPSSWSTATARSSSAMRRPTRPRRSPRDIEKALAA